MDFGSLAPEINSGLMYAGPGAGPLLAAAAAWQGLAAELDSTTSSYSSVLSGLLSSGWQGPASASMAAAAAPYAAWMSTTASQAQQAAAHATAATGAYQSAYAMTVPPPLIAANRAQLTTLVKTNLLGQNTPAIAATEALYSEMWAQDAAAMYGYAGSSAAATTMTPFTAPAPTTNPAAALTQAAGTPTGAGTQTMLSQLTSAIPQALQGIASPAGSTSATSLTSGLSGIFDLLAGNSSSTTGLSGLFNDLFSSNGLGLNNNLWNTIFSSGFYMPGNFIGNMVDFLALSAEGPAGDAATAEEGAAGAAAQGAAAGGAALGELGGAGGAVSASMGEASTFSGLSVPAALGRAATIGGLSAPPSVLPAAGAISPSTGLLGGTPISAPPVAAGMPVTSPLSMAGTAANGSHLVTVPKYGMKPTVMGRSPLGG